jgi:hypothetical protein
VSKLIPALADKEYRERLAHYTVYGKDYTRPRFRVDMLDSVNNLLMKLAALQQHELDKEQHAEEKFPYTESERAYEESYDISKEENKEAPEVVTSTTEEKEIFKAIDGVEATGPNEPGKRSRWDKIS